MAHKKYRILVIYDISDNKKRTAMVRCLEQYCIRVQKSAFEGYVTRRQYDLLSDEARMLIDCQCDSLRMYLFFDETPIVSYGRQHAFMANTIIL